MVLKPEIGKNIKNVKLVDPSESTSLLVSFGDFQDSIVYIKEDQTSRRNTTTRKSCREF